ncbi:MAG: 2-C-methyl-D-erythritol 4-phosphate cytidylyltransferase [Lachnospiraceae bacterium]|nr:2-C-methyl-D-erythritol 4-phosphate cytidylyltransferase [Lachnospiraceae bacterium]
MKNAAIVLAGGNGSRMKSRIKKQYLLLGEYPVLWYSLKVFQKNSHIDEIVLVCGAGETEQCRRQFVEEYGFSKITSVTEGGKERYHSVYEGLKALKDCEYVLIHDGARPFIDDAMLDRVFAYLPDCPACVAGMPVKDTIKIGNENGYVEQTLPREKLWMIQTPQAFSYSLIRRAYDELIRREQEDCAKNEPEQTGSEHRDSERGKMNITDDAMVVESVLGVPVKLIEGSYDNIKITTPEDLVLAGALLSRYKEGNGKEKAE